MNTIKSQIITLTHQIVLNFRREDFEELYFKKETISLTRAKHTKRPFVFLMIGIVLLIIVTIHSVLNGFEVAFYATIFLLFILTQEYSKVYRRTKKWKKTIDEYLDRESKFNEHKLLFSETHFWVKQDENEVIQKWEDFNFVNITEDRIWLDSDENILIPSKSVNKSDYQKLIDIIRKNVIEKDSLL